MEGCEIVNTDHVTILRSDCNITCCIEQGELSRETPLLRQYSFKEMSEFALIDTKENESSFDYCRALTHSRLSLECLCTLWFCQYFFMNMFYHRTICMKVERVATYGSGAA